LGLAAMTITAFLHAALVVTDLEKSDHFYGTLLGLPVIDRQLKFPGRWYQIGEFQVHLIADGGLPDQSPKPEKWGRDRHLAFTVTDLNAIKTKFAEAGYPCQASASGRAALFVHDPDGNTIELNQL
jgi:catechol 2,3-dioxygenase-like lactoylglutathione lyase family enzyme